MHRRTSSDEADGVDFARLFGRFVRERNATNAALLHALGVAPRAALPRLVMYVAGGSFSGGLPVAERLGAAARDAFAAARLPTPPVTVVGQDGDGYLAIDLWTWLAAQHAALEVPPVVEAWRTRRRTGLDARMAIQLRRMDRGQLPGGWIRATEGPEG